MKNLIIIGAGGLGREFYTLAKSCIGYNITFTIKGYLDHNPNALDEYDNYPIIIGNEIDYAIEKEDVFVVAIANINSKKKCVKAIESRGGVFFTLIHHSADVADNVKLGIGCVISRGCIISNDSAIGNHVTFNSNVMVGHDCLIEDFTHINAGVFLGGFVKVEPNVVLHTMAIVIPGITIGRSALVGAGSVVIRNVEDKTTVFGNPAKVIVV